MTADDHAMAAEIVERFAGDRLRALRNVPGLRAAAVRLTEAAIGTEVLTNSVAAQLEQLRSVNSRAWPDAYLAHEAASENAVQRAAAGVRSAVAQAGQIVDPEWFERALADRLASDPRLPIRSELARIPRPTTRPAALAWSRQPVPWFPADRHTDADAVGFDLPEVPRTLGRGAAALGRVDGGPHHGWVQIGLAERHATPAMQHPERPAEQMSVMVGVEVADSDFDFADAPWPFAEGDWRTWVRDINPGADAVAAAADLATASSPLIGLAFTVGADIQRREFGPGLPANVLAPIPALVVMLGLRPVSGLAGFALGDRQGPGIVGRQWRGQLVHDGNYEPVRPAVEGADIVVRPDLFERVMEAAGPGRVYVGAAIEYARDTDADLVD